MQTRKDILIVARTYPTPSKKGIEVSCTAGVTKDNEWIRLFPIPYRFMDYDKRFSKYQWINVAVEKASDPRPESYTIDIDSLKVTSNKLPTKDYWKSRKDIIFPLKSHCLCCLKRERDDKGYPTLGFFRPKEIDSLLIEEDSTTWTDEQLTILHQETLFRMAPKTDLEKVPYKFRSKFKCDDKQCSGHTLLCTDWEMGEAWRQWKPKYQSGWEAKFRQRFEQELIQKCDAHFYVGTLHGHPQNWIIIGLFYPRFPISTS